MSELVVRAKENARIGGHLVYVVQRDQKGVGDGVHGSVNEKVRGGDI